MFEVPIVKNTVGKQCESLLEKMFKLVDGMNYIYILLACLLKIMLILKTCRACVRQPGASGFCDRASEFCA